MRYTFILIGIFLFIAPLTAQKALGLPETFKRPLNLFVDAQGNELSNNNAAQRQLLNTTKKSRDVAWVVISDRDNNPAYNSNSESSEVVARLSFRESFFVLDEKEYWIQIGTGTLDSKLRIDGLQVVGWVRKEKMLLWTGGLVNPLTKINAKAFLLNRADDIERVIERKQDARSLVVDIFRSPRAPREKEPERYIYEYYFVLKIENGMYLLSNQSSLSTRNIESSLIGWVDKRRLQAWNTRICLEPNFAEEAHNERAADKSLRLRGFSSELSVEQFVKEGNTNELYWDADPVIVSEDALVAPERRRYRGDVMRFPMFRRNKVGGVDYFKSGVIGSIKVFTDENGELVLDSELKERDMSRIRELHQAASEKNSNVNIFFVIEATERTYAFKQDMITAIRSLSNEEAVQKAENIQYGALLYRDVPEGDDRLTEYVGLSSSLNRVTDLISTASFENLVDQDDYTALYCGLGTSLQVAGFDKDELNIVVLLGSGGDFSVNKIRKGGAEGHRCLYDTDDKDKLIQNLDDLGVHLHSIQLYNDGARTGMGYAIQSQRYILGTAKYQYSRNAANNFLKEMEEGNPGMKLVQPTMQEPIGMTESWVTSSRPGGILLPPPGESISAVRLKSGLTELATKSLAYEELLEETLYRVLYAGEKLDPRTFSKEGNISATALMSGIADALAEKLKDVPPSILTQALNIKLVVYTELFLPYKLQQAQYPSVQFVLFMPEDDLLDYQRLIERNVSNLSIGVPYPEKRKQLREVYINLIQTFAAEDFLKNTNIEEITREDILELMQGIENEGLDLNLANNFSLGDIENERKVSNQQIDQLIDQFYAVGRELESILKKRNRYEYCFVTEESSNYYYWLRLDQVF